MRNIIFILAVTLFSSYGYSEESRNPFSSVIFGVGFGSSGFQHSVYSGGYGIKEDIKEIVSIGLCDIENGEGACGIVGSNKSVQLFFIKSLNN